MALNIPALLALSQTAKNACYPRYPVTSLIDKDSSPAKPVTQIVTLDSNKILETQVTGKVTSKTELNQSGNAVTEVTKHFNENAATAYEQEASWADFEWDDDEFESLCFEVPAAMVEAKGVPREWAEGFARICTMLRPSVFDKKRWAQIVNDSLYFLDTWGQKAATLGWRLTDVFGIHPRAPLHRPDAEGLVVLLRGKRVSAVDKNIAMIDCGDGIFHRFDCEKTSIESVPLWELKK